MIRHLFLATLILTLPAGLCCGEDDGKLDWSTWQHMPVFGEGRVAPLDTFARETVEAICGRTAPTLVPPVGRPRQFTAAELLFSWLAEPEKWDYMAFLVAQDEQLRQDVLRLPRIDEGGSRLRYASPLDVEKSPELDRRWTELDRQAETEGKGFRATGADKKIKDLVDAYSKYRLLTFDPKASKDAPRRFYTRVRPAANALRKLEGELQGARRVGGDDEIRPLLQNASEALKQLLAPIHGGEFSLEKVETLAAAFSRAADQLAARLAGADDKPLAALAAELHRQAAEMHLALYDNGETLYLAPALNSGALEANRSPGDDAKPWLSFQAILFGSEDLHRSYPQPELQAVRKAWTDAKAAYVDRSAADRPAKFVAAMDRFAAAVRTLAERIEPLRQKLPIRHRDPELIDATAYPPPGSTDVEVAYNQMDPFFWSWVVSLATTVCLLLAVGYLQKPLFWLGMAALGVAQALTLAGLGLRAYVTGLVPLTGMFETVVFVALCVALLGLWFTLLPLFWPGLQTAWRLSGVRQGGRRKAEGGGEGGVERADGRGETGENHVGAAVEYGVGAAVELPHRPRPGLRLARWLLLVVRLGLMVLVFLGLARWPGRYGLYIFDLLPPTAMGATIPSANDVLVWLAGLCVLLTAMYCLPRMAVTAVAGTLAVPLQLAGQGVAAGMKQVFQRRLFVLAGAIVSFVAMVLAYYAPSTVMHRNIGSVTPILRDNYWLAVHVVTIMASYSAAAMALILGNIALGYYLFGRYGAQPLAASPAAGRRPPQACAVLAGFTYTAIRITVLLLTAGTILGALWADKSWGRFWGWDPKEAWALISLLVYLVILHARYVGWSGDFGMALAAVLGFTAVLFTWYGVNFFWGTGMHSYGAGAGGQWAVSAAVTLNWLFLAAAAVRYANETGGGELGRGTSDGEREIRDRG